MKTEIYERIFHLHHKFGPQEFGKICQKLLAIAFRMGGYSRIVERGVQGVDIDAAGDDMEKFTIEVKTTTSRDFNFEQKDYEGLKKRQEDGYKPVLAALRIDRFADWIFAKAEKFKPSRIYIDSLRIHSLEKLEENIIPLFDEALIEHYEDTMREGQSYLDNVLRKQGIELK